MAADQDARMNPQHTATPDLGHICDPPMLWFWRKRKWPEGSVWVCPKCGRQWRRSELVLGGWEWVE